MNIRPLIPEDYPVIDSYMQKLHDLHVQGRPDLFIPASHIYSEADFHEMEQRAKELGAKRIDLMVWEFNESAQELYRSLGMTPQRYILEKLL